MLISKDGANLCATVNLSGGNFVLLGHLPAFHKWRDRDMLFRPVSANIAYMVEHWPNAQWVGGAEEFLKQFHADKKRGEAVRALKESDKITKDESGYEYKRQPMAHQEKAFLLSRDATAFGLFMEQGTGKTKVILDTASYLYGQGKIDMLIIVAWPNGVHRNWVDYELPLDVSVPYEAVFWSAKQTKAQKAKIEKVMAAKNKLKIITFNVEAFTSDKAKQLIERCVTEFKCMGGVDQSACIKNPSAKRTKYLIDKISRKLLYRRILDGAPVAEGADELYSQFKFLDPNIIGHDTWTGFKAQYCKIGYFNEIVGYVNIDALREKIDGYSFRVLADDCLDLPKRMYKRWPFDLTDNERRIYDDMNKKSMAFFSMEPDDDGVMEESLPMVKNMRLQQIASGWFSDRGEPRAIDDTPSRIDALKILLKQADGKALIFARFKKDLYAIQALLGDEAVSYHGGVGEEDRAIAKKRFMEDNSTRYFVGQPQTAGIGHTLTAAKHVIFYNNNPSLRLREECEKRAHRKGLENTLGKGEKLIVWDMIARKTQDTKVVSALRHKKDLSVEIMKDPESFFLIEENENE